MYDNELSEYLAETHATFSWRQIKKVLGVPVSHATLSDIARGKDNISRDKLNLIRAALGWPLLPHPALEPYLCKTCGAIHAVGDCGGVQGKAVILPSDAEVRRKPTPRKRAKAYRPWLPASAGVLIRSEAERRGVSVAVVILGALGISVENL
jgi:transcriptional regulator with XRE-family HTH domain